MKYFLLRLKCLVCEASHSSASVGKLKSACSFTNTLPHVFVSYAQLSHRKILTFFALSNIFTKSINRVPICTMSQHLLGQILGKKYIKIPHPYGGYIHKQQIFHQESCPLMIVVSVLPVEHNSKRGMAIILLAILMMMMMMMLKKKNILVVVVVVLQKQK